jgi:hypothetical protein
MKRIILTLALVGAAGAAQAQVTYPMAPPAGPVTRDENGARVDITGTRVDPNGNRVIGSDKWTYGPGDRGSNIPASPAPSATVPFGQPPQPSVSAQPPQVGEAIPANRPERFKDEYGFRYDGRGNRIDARGNIISPQTKSP